jgi:speckle-type POZ protein
MSPRMGFNNFISVLALNIHVSDLLPSGAITLFCEVELAADLIFVSSSQRSVITHSQSSIISNLGKMLDSDLFSDVTLITTADGKEHKSHKAVLAGCSPVFKAMFENETEEKKLNRVVIEDLEGSTIRSMLEFVYKGTVSDIAVTGFELFQAAEKYSMLGLSQFCQNALTSNLTAANAGQILTLSHMYVAEKLKSECIDFISRNAKQVITTEGWLQLEQMHPQLAIEFFRTNINERKRKRSSDETDSDSD